MLLDRRNGGGLGRQHVADVARLPDHIGTRCIRQADLEVVIRHGIVPQQPPMIRGQALSRDAGKNPIISAVMEYTTRSPSTPGTPALALAITGVSPSTLMLPSIETSSSAAPTPRSPLIASYCIGRLQAKASRSTPNVVLPALSELTVWDQGSSGRYALVLRRSFRTPDTSRAPSCRGSL